MKYFYSLVSIILIWISFFSGWAHAWIFSNDRSDIPYCDTWDCWLEQWIDAVDWVDAVVNDRPASQYIQDVVEYILWFLALIAVLVIIYSWFVLLTAAWDEDKAKKTKTIILYAIVWLIIIFLAGPIVEFVLDILYS